MCSARRRSRSSATGCSIVASGDYKDAPDPTCAPFELVPCDVFITEATFGLPVFRHGDADGRDRQAPAFGRGVSRARASGRRLFARQGAARDRADPQGRLRQADLSARRDGEDHALLPAAAASISASCEPVRGAEQGRACRRHRALPAVGAAGSVDAALSRSGAVLRLGLDAGARARPPARRRIAAGDLRPRRLGRPDRDHRRDRRVRNLGDARPGGRAGALEPGARAEGAAARHRRLRRRGRERRHHRRRSRRERHEPLRRTARPPRL